MQRQLFKLLRRYSPYFVILLVAAIFMHTFVPTNKYLSPFDEYVYLDYIEKVSVEKPFVNQGELTGNFSRKEISCHQIWRPTTSFWGEDCAGLDFPADSKYPWNGITSAHLYTPVYFAPTKIIGKIFEKFNNSPLSASRFANYFWLSAGLIVLFRLLKESGLDSSAAVSLLLFLLATPAIYWSTTYVTPDSMALLIGSCLILVTTRIIQSKISPFWIVPISILALAVKSVFILGALACMMAISLASFKMCTNRFKIRVTRVKLLLAAFLSLASTVCVQKVLSSRVQSDAVGLPPDQGDRIELSVQNMLEAVTVFFGHAFDYGQYSGLIFFICALVLNIFGFSAIAIMPIAAFEKSEYKYLAISALAISFIGGPLLLASTQINLGYTFHIGPRYGLILLPFAIVVLGKFVAKSQLALSFVKITGPIIFATLILFPLSNVRSGYSVIETLIMLKFEILIIFIFSSLWIGIAKTGLNPDYKSIEIKN